MTDFATRLTAALGPGFRVERELGGGGMSRVFLAEEVAYGRRVVVKVMSPELVATVNIERFRREVQLAAQLQHPGIVPLLSSGDGDGLLWYVMPFIEGDSLRARISSATPVSIDEALRVWRDMLEALEYAHRRGVVHRDIKPENVMFSGRQAVVLDFGVAKALSAATGGIAADATGVGMAIGTPAYMAPEQAAGDPQVDARADLYAAALVIYELLAGRGPFSANSAAQMMAAQIAAVPPDVHELRGEVPPAMSTLLMACLAKRPEDRPATASAVLGTLAQIAAASGVRGAASTSTASATRGRGRRIGIAIVCVAALSGAAVGAWKRAGDQDGAMVATVPDSARLQVALLPITRDPTDSVLASSLTPALLSELRDDARLRVLNEADVGLLAQDAGYDGAIPERNVMVPVLRDAGVHSYVVRTLAPVGSGLLITVDGRASDSDSTLFHLEEAVSSAAEFTTASARIAARTVAELRAMVGRIPRPNPTGASFGTSPEAARAFFEAREAARRTDYVTAAAKARVAVQLDSTFGEAWAALRGVSSNLQTSPHEVYMAAASAYHHRAKIRSAASRANTEAAYALLAEGNPLRAIAIVKEALKRPMPLEVATILRTTLTIAYRENRQPELALRTNDEIVRLDGYAGIVTAYNRARLFLEVGRAQDAQSLLDSLDSRQGPASAVTESVRERLTTALHDPAPMIALGAARLQRDSSASARIVSLRTLTRGLALSGRLDSAFVVIRALDREVTQAGISSEIVRFAAQQSLWRAELLGASAQVAEALDGQLRAVRWDTLPILDRLYPEVITARIALGQLKDARRLLEQWTATLPAEVAGRTRPSLDMARGELALAEGNGAEALLWFRSGDRLLCAACAAYRYARAFDVLQQSDSVIFYYERHIASTAVELRDVNISELARAYRRLGELYERRGDVERALQRYGDFVALWKGADPALQPAVQAVRERVAKLQAKRG